MKKDIYPDVRIEIISEGLTKKILGKTKDAAPVVYGEEKPKGENLPNIDSKGKNKEMGGLLQVTNKKPTYTSIVKEAIQELRKDAHDKGTGSRQNFGDLTTGQMDPQTKKRPGKPFTRMTDSAPDEYGSPDQFIVTPPKDADAGVQSMASRRKGIESQVASQTQNMVKEAIFELRKQPYDIPDMERRLGGKTRGAGIGPIPESIGATSATSAEIQSAPRTQTVQRDVPITEFEDKKPGSLGLAGNYTQFGDKYGPVNVRGTMTGTPDLVAPGMPGAGGISRKVGFGSAVERSGLEMESEEAKAARQAQAERAAAGIEEPKGFATEDIDYGVGATATGAGMKEKESEVEMPEPMLNPQPDPGAGSDGDEGLPQPAPGGGGADIDAQADNITKKIQEELELGPRANPEITRPTNPKDSDKLLPKFGSSGYFSAIVDLGEGKNKDFYGVEDITEFLSLYTQNSPAGQFKAPEGDLTSLFAGPKTEKAYIKKAVSKNPFKTSLKKQSPPMAMTMNRPPNMGVGQQQPVVTGAGTMKADVAANKPKAAPARTKAPRRAAGSIEQRKEKAYIARQAQKALIKSGMVWDSINKQWVPTRG
tara:strand:- start:3759 stop:5537 length:1779 start_codon:yes stop_codon:yes gene_type:complete